MNCPSCGKPMRLIQRVTVDANFVDIDPDEGGGEKIEVEDQRSGNYWECKPCKISRLDE